MSRRALAWIFALGLAARLLVLPCTLPRYAWGRAYPDTAQYEAMASNLRAGRGLVVGPGAVAVRPPLYPLVLAAFQSALGEGRAFAGAVILAQALLGAFGCALAADLGGRLFGPLAGRIAGAVSALHPELLLYASLLLTETLAVVLVTAALWAAGRALAAASPARWALLCGACCGAAALTRASLLPLAGMAALWLAWMLPARRPALAAAACCVAAACAVIGPWTVRNRLRLGAWVPVTTKMGWDLYEQFCPEATGGPIYGTIRWPGEVRALGEVEADRFLRHAAWRELLARPGRAAALTLVRVRRLWNPFPNDPGHRTPAVMGVSLLANLPLFLLALASAVLVLRGSPAAWTLAALPVLLLGLLHAVFMGSVRYRAPALPALGVMAGAALARLRKAPGP